MTTPKYPSVSWFHSIFEWKSLYNALDDGSSDLLFLDGWQKQSTCEVKSATCNGINVGVDWEAWSWSWSWLQEFDFKDPTMSKVPQGYFWMTAQPAQDGSCIALRIQQAPESGMDDCSCTTSGNANVCLLWSSNKHTSLSLHKLSSFVLPLTEGD